MMCDPVGEPLAYSLCMLLPWLIGGALVTVAIIAVLVRIWR